MCYAIIEMAPIFSTQIILQKKVIQSLAYQFLKGNKIANNIYMRSSQNLD